MSFAECDSRETTPTLPAEPLKRGSIPNRDRPHQPSARTSQDDCKVADSVVAAGGSRGFFRFGRG